MLILQSLRKWLRQSSRVHIRERRVNTAADLVSLLDRFLDDKLTYPLEWDDFISWSNAAPEIEAVRQRIAESESLFFSTDSTDRSKAAALVAHERNRVAALVGLRQR